MANAGEVLDVPALGVSVEFRRTTEETGGELVEFDLVGRPQGFITQPHVHPNQHERHEVIEGRFWMRTGALERLLGPGESVETPAGVEHSHGTHEPGRVRIQIRPALRFEEWLERLAVLRYFPGGWPKPVDAAALLLDFEGEARLSKTPVAVQQAAARGVLKVAEATGQSRR
jgi:quercetin dioxygenase-like cupin family protein